LALAIWGALTGTIALFLRVREFLKDRPKLIVRPQFEYTFLGNSYPPPFRLEARIINRGRRPVTIEAVIGQVRPKEWWSVPIWWIKRKGRIGLKYDVSMEITEGRAASIYVGGDRLPDDFRLADLRRVIVRDQTGRNWKSRKRFGQKQLQDYLLAQEIKTERIGQEKDQRFVEAKLYRVGKSYSLRWSVKDKTSTSYRRKEYRNLNEAELGCKGIIENGQKYVSGQLESM
jgi:hypothetical protein